MYRGAFDRKISYQATKGTSLSNLCLRLEIGPGLALQATQTHNLLPTWDPQTQTPPSRPPRASPRLGFARCRQTYETAAKEAPQWPGPSKRDGQPRSRGGAPEKAADFAGILANHLSAQLDQSFLFRALVVSPLASSILQHPSSMTTQTCLLDNQ